LGIEQGRSGKIKTIIFVLIASMVGKIKNRHRLKAKETTQVMQEIQTVYHQDFFDSNATVETGNLEDSIVIFVNDDIDFFRVNNHTLLTLRGVIKHQPARQRVVVDMGAIRFITNGADIMAAGIVDADPTIQVNDAVWICDETHHKPLAVGIALMTGEEMKNLKTGKAIKNMHYVGDSLWNNTKPIV
jgi:PUA domain protein